METLDWGYTYYLRHQLSHGSRGQVSAVKAESSTHFSPHLSSQERAPSRSSRKEAFAFEAKNSTRLSPPPWLSTPHTSFWKTLELLLVVAAGHGLGFDLESAYMSYRLSLSCEPDWRVKRWSQNTIGIAAG